MRRKHVVITGTGRAGTTFLVQLLTNLGLDTGHDKASVNALIHPHAKAGLERNILQDNIPYIVKDPWFCDIVDGVLARPDIEVCHVYIPMRNLYAAAESRRRVTRETLAALSADERKITPPHLVPGGLWHTDKPEQQESILLMQLYKLLLSLSKTDIPVTLLHYPRITSDAPYLYAKLKSILGTIELAIFARVYAKTVRPDWVSQFGSDDR